MRIYEERIKFKLILQPTELEMFLDTFKQEGISLQDANH
jgi:hypothetical protein